eukprot:CAMPEP_0184691794 /NCGR_PEP_ID=MMETSP0313-20130426/527_1 /TAXON_ID=2792 /ORGANISM="Porphyridium aerugineum, Strain SAG 1380-2" /LENGTH=284 /DNA_ID=CAMNT_0027149559 /DNA_START=68 /DNA_END=922 /DNA_ORIENTATION=-
MVGLSTSQQQKELTIPSKFHGKIIGKQHATLNAIEQETGAKIVMPEKDSGSDKVLVMGSEEAINDAVAKIATITDLDLGVKKTPGELLRQRANEAGKKRAELSAKSQDAYKSGDGAAAKEFSNQAKQQEEIIHKLNKEAGETIFQEKNKGKSLYEIDLHGLYVEEALDQTEKRIGELEADGKNKGNSMKIITGRGNHSEDNVAKIRPAVLDMLKKKGYQVDESDPGSYTITLKTGAAAGGAPTPASTGIGGKPAPSPAGEGNQEEPKKEGFLRKLFGVLFSCFK